MPGRLDAPPSLPPRWVRLRPLVSVGAFAAGFAWDAFTLRRVDQVADNLILLTYLLALGLAIGLEQRAAFGLLSGRFWTRNLERLRFVAQFFAGGLWSAYVIFFFKSASRLPSLLFTALLVVLLVANEFAEGFLRRDRVRLALFTFCAHAFFLFFIPVMTSAPLVVVPVLAGGLALALAAAVTALGGWSPRLAANLDATWVPGDPEQRTPFRVHLRDRFVVAASVVALLLGLEWAGVVPPVPLSVVESGIYHGVERTERGYELRYESPPWFLPYRTDDRPFLHRDGDEVYCWSAIFAPRARRVEVQHQWMSYDELRSTWIERDRLPFQVVGGRDGGFRGYTKKRNIEPGKWRVRFERADGRELGRIDFEIIADSAAAPRTWNLRLR